MNEQKARELRRIECAHERFIGVMLAVGMPPSKSLETQEYYRRIGKANEAYRWFDNEYRERVGNFYIASFTSAPRPNAKTVKKFVRSYMRWLQQQYRQRQENGDE